MDVRCDRCQTEYELDDDSVSEGGASVQCTTCGHTFVVGRNGVTIAQIVPMLPTPPSVLSSTSTSPVTPSGGLSDLAGPQAADWLLATEDGQTHRFRDLTTLQKWIVERKATRDDRLSQRGGQWRPLAEVGELAPFFDVVDQADRARSGENGRRFGSRSPAGAVSRAMPSPGSGRMRHGGIDSDSGAFPSHLDSGRIPTLDDGYELSPGQEPEPDDVRFQTMAIFRRHRVLKITGIAGFAALAIVAAFVGFSRPRWLPFFKTTEPAKAVASAPPAAAAASPPPVTAPGATNAPVPPLSPSPSPSSTSAPARGAPVVAPIPQAPVAPPPAEHPVTDATIAVKGKSYERLVGDADRLMENGQPARAQKLLDQALLLQPNGVAALSGVAYLMLDRQRPLAAISTFKRALGYSPEFPPALFGLAEAYRAQGDLPGAAENYRKYLGVAPGGPDAPAARRQLREIDSLAPRHTATPATSPAPAKPEKSEKSDDPFAPGQDPAP